MNQYLRDVLSQPAALRSALQSWFEPSYLNRLKRLAEEVSRRSRVVFVGMGSSRCCAMAASSWLVRQGLDSRVVSASHLLHHERELLDHTTLPVFVSQSGESGEIAALLDTLPPGLCVVGITNEPESCLGRRADVLLPMHVPGESVPSTRTYLASVALCALVAHACAGRDITEARDHIETALGSLERVLASHDRLRGALAGWIRDCPCVAFLGRGSSLSTVHAAALFAREAGKTAAMEFESAEFRHGPIEMVDGRFRAMIFAPVFSTWELNARLAADIVQAGGQVALVSGRPVPAAGGVLAIEYSGVEEFWAPLVEIGPAQLLCNELAVARGFDPAVFRRASKVTRTQ